MKCVFMLRNARDRYVRHDSKRVIAERSLVHIVNDKNAIACSSRSFFCANVTTRIAPAISEIRAAVSCAELRRVEKFVGPNTSKPCKVRARRSYEVPFPNSEISDSIARNLWAIGASILYAEKDCFPRTRRRILGPNPLKFNSNFSNVLREDPINGDNVATRYDEIILSNTREMLRNFQAHDANYIVG